MPDEAYIQELQDRAAQTKALLDKVRPPAPPLNVAEENFSIRDRYTDADYDAVGAGAEVEDLRRTFKIDPGTLALLDRCYENPPSEEDLIAAYLPGSASVFGAAQRRTQHVAQARADLEAAGWDVDLKPLPKAAIDLLVRSLEIQKRMAEDRARLGLPR